ncbi:hypothetical protein SDC9_183343 [bioreactor metagenome]|uniref:Uncharacterized protein n=1 Tax=bioreactor metagenome TaxID=1076179 RepID=A0A645H9Y4_9ZZZZ
MQRLQKQALQRRFHDLEAGRREIVLREQAYEQRAAAFGLRDFDGDGIAVSLDRNGRSMERVERSKARGVLGGGEFDKIRVVAVAALDVGERAGQRELAVV